jgi:hypothetical protein
MPYRPRHISPLTAAFHSVALAAALLLACGDDGGETDTGPDDLGATDVGDLADLADSAEDLGDSALPDVIVTDTITPDGLAPDTRGDDADATPDSGDSGDADVDAGPPPPELVVGPPLRTPPADPLAESELESCAVFEADRCVDDRVQRCDVYDLVEEAFLDAEELDPLFRRVLRYERWYDLYHSPNGQTAERGFSSPQAADTAESIWGDPGVFREYEGVGDAAIWTGVALNAYLLRYLETGTEADYARFEAKVRDLLRLFEVTGIDGYLARHHFLQVAEGAPNTDEAVIIHGESRLDHRDRAIPAPSEVDGLPALYATGLVEGDAVWEGTPMWHGNPSIDQYTGPMVALPAAFAALRDDTLRAAITRHLTCYLNRLERLEIRNLRADPEIQEALQAFFAGGTLDLDEGDPDFTELDTLVGYYLPQINDANADEYPVACPAAPQLEPTRVVDASSLLTLLAGLGPIVSDLQSRDEARATSIDHFYAPSVRGGDAIHLMHLAAMAYYFTGDETYRSFLRDELIGEIGADRVALTAGSLVPPRWCRSFYGEHITLPPLWAFINLLEDSPLRAAMVDVMEVEGWQKLAFDLDNAVFDLMYAAAVPEGVATARDEAIARALLALEVFGGNGGVLEDPRRDYDHPFSEVVAALPEGAELVCPTEDERALCEDGFQVFGLTVPGEDITRTCSGTERDCPVGDGGECAQAMARDALPAELRQFSDFAWQRNPFAVGLDRGVEGLRQSPGLDLIEPFWLARYYGLTDAGRGEVLAWRPSEVACGGDPVE